MKVLKNYFLILIMESFLFLIGSGCMKMEGPVPSRIAITHFDGEEVSEAILAQGMTYRLHSGVYLSSLTGEQYVGSVFQSGHVSDSLYEVLGSNIGPTVTLQKEGCILAQNPGAVIVRLSAFSLRKGGLDAFTTVRVNSVRVSQPSSLKSQVQAFSVSQLRSAKGETLYGLTMNDRFHLIRSTGVSALSDPQGVALEAQLASGDSVNSPLIWADQGALGFFSAYGKRNAGKDHLTIISFHRDGKPLPGLFDSSATIDIQKIYGGQYSNGVPIAFALVQNKDSSGNPTTLSLFALSHNIVSGVPQVQEGFINEQGKTIEMNVADRSELDRIVQFAQSDQGISYFAMGTDRIKVVSVDHQKGVSIDTPDGMILDRAGSFGFDVSDGTPKIAFIKNGKLLFSQKIAGGWVLAFKELADQVDPSFSPRLISSREDGTVAVSWKTTQNQIKFRLSQDGGNTWIDHLLLPSLPSGMELVVLPCGGMAILTVEASVLKLTFVDALQKQFSSAYDITSLASGIKKIQIFRDHEHIRIFYLLDDGNLYFSNLN